jgi:hypothetical protein
VGIVLCGAEDTSNDFSYYSFQKPLNYATSGEARFSFSFLLGFTAGCNGFI